MLALMQRDPTTVATLFAVSTAAPLVDVGVWCRVRCALVLKTVLEFLEFWQAKSAHLKAALFALHPNCCPLLSVAAAARQGLRSSPVSIPGPVNLTGVAKPVQGGLWYTFATAKLLGAVTADMDDL